MRCRYGEKRIVVQLSPAAARDAHATHEKRFASTKNDNTGRGAMAVAAKRPSGDPRALASRASRLIAMTSANAAWKRGYCVRAERGRHSHGCTTAPAPRGRREWGHVSRWTTSMAPTDARSDPPVGGSAHFLASLSVAKPSWRRNADAERQNEHPARATSWNERNGPAPGRHRHNARCRRSLARQQPRIDP
jgi:hypothetical protein